MLHIYIPATSPPSAQGAQAPGAAVPDSDDVNPHASSNEQSLRLFIFSFFFFIFTDGAVLWDIQVIFTVSWKV